MKINRVKCKYCGCEITFGSTHICLNNSDKEVWKGNIHNRRLFKNLKYNI